MSPSERSNSTDPLEQAAALIRDVGRSAQRARRYRELATTVAGPTFDRALAIGSDVRRIGRGSTLQAQEAIAAATTELGNLLVHCEGAIDALHASPIYREAVTTFTAGAAERMAAIAPSIFTDVTNYPSARLLYWPVPLASRQPGVHFLPPEECAIGLQAIAANGVLAPTLPLELGGDETIQPVLLTDDHDGSESPIALAFQPHDLPAPVCRLEGSHATLFYASRLCAEFAVICRAEANDEWWDIRPDAYRTYIEELREALEALRLRVTIEP